MKYDDAEHLLLKEPQVWLITGCAGFIGSNLLERLLSLNQRVVGLDNFSTGKNQNLDEVKTCVTPEQWSRFQFIEGDIADLTTCQRAVEGVDHVLHQAALGSVPRSVKDPITTNKSNIDGFLNMLVASRDGQVRSFTYAASSSTYGDHPALPKVEDVIGNPLSPYAVTKLVNELYANVFARVYNFKSIGLRYFNVFGKRQDPDGAYAAVIPKWVAAMIKSENVVINGDGETSRDFCFVENVIEANIISALASPDAKGQIYNIALGDRTSLNELFELIKCALFEEGVRYNMPPKYIDFRVGDVLHSQADIQKAKKLLNFEPKYKIALGLKNSMKWYVYKLSKN